MMNETNPGLALVFKRKRQASFCAECGAEMYGYTTKVYCSGACRSRAAYHRKKERSDMDTRERLHGIIDRLHESSVEALMEVVEDFLIHGHQSRLKEPKKSMYGALADLGPAPTEEEIDENRKVMLGQLPWDAKEND